MIHVTFDHDRTTRIGLPEAVFCEGKPPEVLNELVLHLAERQSGPVLFTRLNISVLEQLGGTAVAALDYDPLSRTAFLGGTLPVRAGFSTAVVTAGTADLAVAQEVVRTLEFLGLPSSLITDVGVAGIWRLQAKMLEINQHDAVVAIAGLDAALATVLGAMTPLPVVAVPTSVGYGVARGGTGALHSMLSSCAAGLAVMNIDNGFGAAFAVARMANLLRTRTNEK
jgi:NCAIR mutase (PurE)-related protein